MTKTAYARQIAEIRRFARKAGWSLRKVDAAQGCAADWANATQNTRNDSWNDSEWRDEAVTHFSDFTDGDHDGHWQETCGFKE